jgi:hypothetical protein
MTEIGGDPHETWDVALHVGGEVGERHDLLRATCSVISKRVVLKRVRRTRGRMPAPA